MTGLDTTDPGESRAHATEPGATAPGTTPAGATQPPSVRSRAALGLTAAAAVGRFELQVCRNCGAVQYPPREACHRCLSSQLEWRLQAGGAELLAQTTLRHSHDEFFRARLPIRLGLVRLDSGPTAVVYLADGVVAAPARVNVKTRLDKAGQGVLVAFPQDAAREGVVPLGALPDGAGSIAVGQRPSAEAAQSRLGDSGMTQSGHLREMSCDPRGRKVLVCDAGSVLGVALVRSLIDVGADVVWAGLGPAASESGALQDLLNEFKQVQLVSLDVTSDESVSRLAAQVGSQVDVLINNAEVCAPTPAVDLGPQPDRPASDASMSGASAPVVSASAPLAAARTEIDTNYFGSVRLARAFAPLMRATSANAPVSAPSMAWVNLLSIYALSSLPTQSTFSASKAAAYSFSQSLRAEMLPAGIRVLNVFPGPVDDECHRELPPPKLALVALARAIVGALQQGIEDLYPGEVAQDGFARWRNNPKGLEFELATDR